MSEEENPGSITDRLYQLKDSRWKPVRQNNAYEQGFLMFR